MQFITYVLALCAAVLLLECGLSSSAPTPDPHIQRADNYPVGVVIAAPIIYRPPPPPPPPIYVRQPVYHRPPIAPLYVSSVAILGK